MARVTKRAAVSTADFYKHFKSKDECFAAAYDSAVERIDERIRDACGGEEDWPTSVRE